MGVKAQIRRNIIHQFNEKNKPFKCDNCDANFAFKYSVKDIRTVHRQYTILSGHKETPLKCPICKEEFFVIHKNKLIRIWDQNKFKDTHRFCP